MPEIRYINLSFILSISGVFCIMKRSCVRNLTVGIMLILIVLSSVLDAVMHSLISISGEAKLFPWVIFSNPLIPILFFLPGLFFRNRFCILTAFVITFFNLFIQTLSIAVFLESFMLLDYSSILLLAEHTDLTSIRAVLGKKAIWLIPASISVLAGVIFCCRAVWKTGTLFRAERQRKWIAVYSILLLLSIVSHIGYCAAQSNSLERNLDLAPLSLRLVSFAAEVFRESPEAKEPVKYKIPETSEKILRGMNVIPSVRKDLSSRKQAVLFDRIIILAVESLDYDFIGRINPAMPEGITPNLDRFSANYVSLSNYFSAAQPTSWGLCALLLSRPDFVRDRELLPPSLFKIAGQHGFHSCYYSSASGHFGNNRKIYDDLFQPGEALFLEEWQNDFHLTQKSLLGLSDKHLFRGVLTALRKQKHKRYIALISPVDTHPPYFLHEKTEKELEKRFPNDFLLALHHTDRMIGNFVDELMADPALFDDRTLIIITADHTATFGENYLKRKDFSPGRIPLIFISRNQDPFRKIRTDKYASSLDLAPTLLRLIGAGSPPTFMGRDLWSAKNCAISWMLPNRLFVRTPEHSISIDLGHPNQIKKGIPAAFADFYFSFYGKE